MGRDFSSETFSAQDVYRQRQTQIDLFYHEIDDLDNLSSSMIGVPWRTQRVKSAQGTIKILMKSDFSSAVSEKWFHYLNSQNKFSRHKQNNNFKCVQKNYSPFANGGTIHVTPTYV